MVFDTGEEVASLLHTIINFCGWEWKYSFSNDDSVTFFNFKVTVVGLE